MSLLGNTTTFLLICFDVLHLQMAVTGANLMEKYYFLELSIHMGCKRECSWLASIETQAKHVSA